MTLFFNLKTSDNLAATALLKDTLLVADRNCETGAYAAPAKFGLPHSVVTYLNDLGKNTVQDLFNLADSALGGKTVPVSLDDIAKAVDVINNAFDGCGRLVGYVDYVEPVWTMASRMGVISTGETEQQAITTMKVKAFPNPYTDRIQFSIESTVSGRGTLVVYNTLGQKIKTVFEGNITAGRGQVVEYKVPNASRMNLIYMFTINGKRFTGKLLNVK